MKKIILILTIFLLYNDVFALEEASYLDIVLNNNNKVDITSLSDGNIYNSVFLSEEEILITSKENIQGLYLIIDVYPTKGIDISCDGYTFSINTGYFQEYIDTSMCSTEVILNLNGDSTIKEIKAIGEGEIPSDIHNWSAPHEKVDILFFPTHADDEMLFFGAALATYTNDTSLNIQIAYMVNHSTEVYRQQELLNGLWEIGIRNYPIIPDFPDIYSYSLEHALTIYNQDEIIAYQVSLIERFEPQIIINHDLNGEYGHGAHILNAYSILEAVELSEFKVSKLYLHLYEENNITLDIDTPLENFNNMTAFEVAEISFAHHVSQSTYFSVSRYSYYNPASFGLIYTNVGYDTSNDMMENIVSYYEQDLLEAEATKLNEEAIIDDFLEEGVETVDDISNEVSSNSNLKYIALGIISLAVIFTLILIVRKDKKIKNFRELY